MMERVHIVEVLIPAVPGKFDTEKDAGEIHPLYVDTEATAKEIVAFAKAHGCEASYDVMKSIGYNNLEQAKAYLERNIERVKSPGSP